jgi:hypothetical protein
MMGQAWPHWTTRIMTSTMPACSTAWALCRRSSTPTVRTRAGPSLKGRLLQEEGYVGYGIRSGGMVRVSPDGALHPNLPWTAMSAAVERPCPAGAELKKARFAARWVCAANKFMFRQNSACNLAPRCIPVFVPANAGVLM